jgi:hypothetical protein
MLPGTGSGYPSLVRDDAWLEAGLIAGRPAGREIDTSLTLVAGTSSTCMDMHGPS